MMKQCIEKHCYCGKGGTHDMPDGGLGMKCCRCGTVYIWTAAELAEHRTTKNA